MINVTNDFINLIPEPGKVKDSYITYDDKNVKPQTTTISFQGTLFKTVMREIDLEIKNNENIIDKEFNVKYGLYVNGAFEYINYGTFKVTECEEVIKENKIKATSYDNMVKFMVKYDLTNLGISFPCTILELVQAMCNFVEVGLYNTNFYNANLIIPEDLFTVLNCTYRDVLDFICQATCTTGIIKDDKLYLKKIEDHRDFVVGPKLLKTITFKSKFGPCNSLVLGRGDLNDNIYSKDDESIATNGLQEIKFDNNEIVDKRREEVIDGMFEQIKGIEYNAFEATDLGIGFLEAADLITAQDMQENNYDVLVLNASITITSGTAGTMESDAPSTSTTNYSYATDSEKRQSRTEAIVNKQEKRIDLISEEQETTKTELEKAIGATNEEFDNFVNETYEQQMSNIQAQIDGQIQSYFYDYEPTLTNVPASEWTSEDEKIKHMGDLFYDSSTGLGYRFSYLNNEWSWEELKDTDVGRALANAQNALNVANNKRRVFVTTPTPPYDVGDLWITDSRELKSCKVAKSSGNYEETDWQDFVYTEKINEAIKQVEVLYALSDSNTVAPTNGWSTVAPEWVQGKYMWQKTVVHYTNGDTSQSEATCISGAKRRHRRKR